MTTETLRDIAIIGVVGNSLINVGVSADVLMSDKEAEVLDKLLGSITSEQLRERATELVREAVERVVKEAPTNEEG